MPVLLVSNYLKSKKHLIIKIKCFMVAEAGLEPTTSGL